MIMIINITPNEIIVILDFWMILQFALIFLMPLLCSSTVVILGGGSITINGAVTSSQIDIFVNFTANAKWLAVIWSQDQTDADVHLLQVDSTNTASPITVSDCYLDQNSYIKKDNIDNIQPSITNFKGSISNGMTMAYNRNLVTGDTQDLQLYVNSVIQVCFIYSLQTFVGAGYEKGNQKVCSYLSLHMSPTYLQDRLLGNYACTTLFGGGNLTAYATLSTDDISGQYWLFLAILHKQQGLNAFTGKWIAVEYVNFTVNTDLAMISYERINNTLAVQIRDMYTTNTSYAATDQSYVINQGGQDLTTVLSGYDSTAYIIASYKRKFSTGDVNRDIVINTGANRFCFIYGNALAYTTFTQMEIQCLNLTITTGYSSYFRVSSNSNSNVIYYNPPNNTVIVIKADEIRLITSLLALIFVAIMIS